MEDTPQEIIEERHGSSRRDFLKKSAVTGAVVWSAPAISTLSSRAWAAGYPPPDCECRENAYALFAVADGIIDGTVGPVSQVGENDDDASLADLDVLDGLVTAKLLTAKTRECRAHASVAEVKIDLSVLDIELLDISTIEATVLTADANGETCTGDSSIATLKINGEGVTVKTEPNDELELDLGALGSIKIVFNEQSGNGSIAVNALHVFVNLADLQTLDVIVSHAETTCC